MNISNWSDNTMKLKFKADASDVLIFIIFAIFLFYIVCLGILNFPELASTGHFYGQAYRHGCGEGNTQNGQRCPYRIRHHKQ